jgi:hypothetical protein
MLIHTDYDTVGLKGMRNRMAVEVISPTTPPESPVDPSIEQSAEFDPELSAYNARLAELATSGPKTWRNPETTVVRKPR